MSGMRTPLADRLWAKVDVGHPAGCWNWTAAVNTNGYGVIAAGSRSATPSFHLAHRLSYELLIGDIADEMVIDHLCRNRRCVNPDHLEVVTRSENVRRSFSPAHRSHRENRCKRGHVLTGNAYFKANGWRQCRTCQLARAAEARAVA